VSKDVYVLKIKDLNKTFDSHLLEKPHQALKNLSFEIKSGHTTGFVGVNGAGKTTTLKCALGFVFPDSGTVDFFNEGPLTSESKKKLGYLPERPYYYDFLTAKQFLKFHWDLTGGGGDFERRAEEILNKVNLKNVINRSLRSFSKGMLQRIGLAQALLRQPKFLILDEPMSGLDPDGRILIKNIMREEKLKGTTLFFSSHLLGDMDELCDDLVVIDQGRLVYQGTLKDFAKDKSVEESFHEMRVKLGADQ
jgi:ABC-2 type transport system ATP-binding protein